MLKLTIARADAANPEPPDVAGSDVEVWRDHDGTVLAYGHIVDGLHRMYLPGLASFCFGQDVEGVTALPHWPVREDLILDAYYRTVLPMALQVRGLEVLHASAVLTPRGVVALCAVSGTGKSTVAFGLSQRGWPLWADDAVAFETSEPGARAIPLPFGTRLRPGAAAFFGQDTAVTRPRPHSGEGQRVPLAALLVLNRTHDGSDGAAVRIRQLSSAQAFVDVLAHAYCFSLQDLKRKQSMMHHYLDLVARVPVFEIRLRSGLETLPASLTDIGRLISSVG
jgi:hypothetical protein